MENTELAVLIRCDLICEMVRRAQGRADVSETVETALDEVLDRFRDDPEMWSEGIILMRPTLTKHATVRTQQRAVPPLISDLLVDYGSSMRHDGADVYFFDKQSRGRLKRALGGHRGLDIIARWLNTYVVLGEDGDVITVARRTTRLKRP